MAEDVPTAKWEPPPCTHPTEHTVSDPSSVSNCSICPVPAFHKYTELPKATASILDALQSTKLRSESKKFFMINDINYIPNDIY